MVDVTIEAADGTAEGWLAYPADRKGTAPGVLFFIDGLGLRRQIREMADRIASWGYVVLVPNLFYRSGTVAETSPRGDLRQPGAREAYFAEVRPRIAALAQEDLKADAAAYVSALTRMPCVRKGRPIGVLGYCMGVRLALRAAGDHPDVVKAVAGFHGGELVTNSADSPHLSLRTAKADVLLRHADNDPSLPPDHMAILARTADEWAYTSTRPSIRARHMGMRWLTPRCMSRAPRRATSTNSVHIWASTLQAEAGMGTVAHAALQIRTSIRVRRGFMAQNRPRKTTSEALSRPSATGCDRA